MTCPNGSNIAWVSIGLPQSPRCPVVRFPVLGLPEGMRMVVTSSHGTPLGTFIDAGSDDPKKVGSKPETEQ